MVGGPINVPTVVAVIVVFLLQLGSRQPASLSNCTSSGIWSAAGNVLYHMLVGLEPLLTSASLFTVLTDQKLHRRTALCLRRWAALVPCTSHLLSMFLNQDSDSISELHWWLSPLASALLINSNQDTTTAKAVELSLLYTLSLAAAVLEFAQHTGKYLANPNVSSTTSIGAAPALQTLAMIPQLVHRTMLLAATHIALLLWSSRSTPWRPNTDPGNPNPQTPAQSPPSAAPHTHKRTTQPLRTLPLQQHPRAEFPPGWQHLAGAEQASGAAPVLDTLLTRDGTASRNMEATINIAEPLPTPFNVACERPQPTTNFPPPAANYTLIANLPQHAGGSFREQLYGWHGDFRTERSHVVAVRLVDAAVLAYQLIASSSAALAATDDNVASGCTIHGAPMSTDGGQNGGAHGACASVDVCPVPGAAEAMTWHTAAGAAPLPSLSGAAWAANAAAAISATDASSAAVVVRELQWLGALLVASWGATVLVLNAIWVLWPRAQRPNHAGAVNSAASWLATLARTVLLALLSASGDTATGASYRSSGGFLGSPGSSGLLSALSMLMVHLLASNLPVAVFISQSAAAAAGTLLLHKYHSPTEHLASLAALYGGVWLAAVLVAYTLARAFSPAGSPMASLPAQSSSVVIQTPATAASTTTMLDVPDSDVTSGTQPADSAMATAAAALLANTEGEHLQALFGPDASSSAVHRLPPLLIAQALVSSFQSRNCSPRGDNRAVGATAFDSLLPAWSWSSECKESAVALGNQGSPFGLSVTGGTTAAVADGVSDADGGLEPMPAQALGASQKGRSEPQPLESARSRTSAHMRKCLLDTSSLDALPMLPPFERPRLFAQAALMSSSPPPQVLAPPVMAAPGSALGHTATEAPMGSAFDALIGGASGGSLAPLLSRPGRHVGSTSVCDLGFGVRRAASEQAEGHSNAPPYALPPRWSYKGEGMVGLMAGQDAATSVAGAAGIPPPRRAPSPSPTRVLLPQTALASGQTAVLIREGSGAGVSAREDANKVPLAPGCQAHRPAPSRGPSQLKLPSPIDADVRNRLPTQQSPALVATAGISPAASSFDQSALSSTILDADMYDRLLSSASSPFLLNTAGLRGARINSTQSTGTLPVTSLAMERRIMYRNSSGVSELSCSIHGASMVTAPSPTGWVTPSVLAPDSSLSKVGEDVLVAAQRSAAGAVWGPYELGDVRQLQHPLHHQQEMANPQHIMVHGRGMGGMRAIAAGDTRARIEEENICSLSGGEGLTAAAGRPLGLVKSRFERTLGNADWTEGEQRQVIVLADGRQVYQSETLAAATSASLNILSPFSSTHLPPAQQDGPRKAAGAPSPPGVRPSSRLSHSPSSHWDKRSASGTSLNGGADGAIRSHSQPPDALPQLQLLPSATRPAGACAPKRSSRSSRELAPPASPSVFSRLSGPPTYRGPSTDVGRYPVPGTSSVSSSYGSGLTFGRTHTGATSFTTADSFTGSCSGVTGGSGGRGGSVGSSLGPCRRSWDLARHLHDTGLIRIGEDEAAHGHGDDESGALFATCAWEASAAMIGQNESVSGPVSFVLDHGFGFLDDDRCGGELEVADDRSPEGLCGITLNAFGMDAEGREDVMAIAGPGPSLVPSGPGTTPAHSGGGGRSSGGRVPERRVACSGAWSVNLAPSPSSTPSSVSAMSHHPDTLQGQQQELRTQPHMGPSVAAAAVTTNTIEFQVPIQVAKAINVPGSFLSEARQSGAAAASSGGAGGKGCDTSDDSTPRVIGASHLTPAAANLTAKPTATSTASTLVSQTRTSNVALLTMLDSHPATHSSATPQQPPALTSGMAGVSISGTVARHSASGGSQRSSSNPSLLSFADMTLGCMLPGSGASALPSNVSGGAVSLTRAYTSTIHTGPAADGHEDGVREAGAASRSGGCARHQSCNLVSTPSGAATGGGGGGASESAHVLECASHRVVCPQTLAPMTCSGSAGRGSPSGLLLAPTSYSGGCGACSVNGSDGRLGVIVGGGMGSRPTLPELLASTAAAAAAIHNASAGGGGVSAVTPYLWASQGCSATQREAAPASAASSTAAAITTRQANLTSRGPPECPPRTTDGHRNSTVQGLHGPTTSHASRVLTDCSGGHVEDLTSAVLPSQPLSQLLSQPLDSTHRSRYAWFGIFLKRTGSTAGHMGSVETPSPAYATPYSVRPSASGMPVPEGYVIGGGGRTSRTSRLSGGLIPSRSLSRAMDDTARLSSVKFMLRGLRKRIRSGLKNLGGNGGSGVASSGGSFEDES